MLANVSCHLVIETEGRGGLGPLYELPVVALLAGEALQVVDVGPRPHHHLEGRNHLLARRAVTRRPEQPAGEERRNCQRKEKTENAIFTRFPPVFHSLSTNEWDYES